MTSRTFGNRLECEIDRFNQTWECRADGKSVSGVGKIVFHDSEFGSDILAKGDSPYRQVDVVPSGLIGQLLANAGIPKEAFRQAIRDGQLRSNILYEAYKRALRTQIGAEKEQIIKNLELELAVSERDLERCGERLEAELKKPRKPAQTRPPTRFPRPSRPEPAARQLAEAFEQGLPGLELG